MRIWPNIYLHFCFLNLISKSFHVSFMTRNKIVSYSICHHNYCLIISHYCQYCQSKQEAFKQKKYRILMAFIFLWLYAESSLLHDNVAFVICLDSLGTGDELFLHVSRPPKPGTPQYSFIQQLEQVKLNYAWRGSQSIFNNKKKTLVIGNLTLLYIFSLSVFTDNLCQVPLGEIWNSP